MKKMRALLVGTGLWAENHVKAYQSCKHVEVVAIVDVMKSSKARLDQLAVKYGIPFRGHGYAPFRG